MELIQLISTSNNKPDICILGYPTYITNKENSTRGGLAALIKNSIPHIQIKYQATNNNIEVLGLAIQHNAMPIYIINVYSPPGAAHFVVR